MKASYQLAARWLPTSCKLATKLVSKSVSKSNWAFSGLNRSSWPLMPKCLVLMLASWCQNVNVSQP